MALRVPPWLRVEEKRIAICSALKRLLFSSTRSHGGHGGPRRVKKVVANRSFMIDIPYVEFLVLRVPPCPPWLRVEEKANCGFMASRPADLIGAKAPLFFL